METIKLDRISPQAFEINQRICAGLRAALAAYNGEKLTARFATVLKKYLPADEFHVWMYFEKSFGWYRLRISPANLSNFNREGKDYYSVVMDEQILAENRFSGEPVDWRAKMSQAITRFSNSDSFAWENNREPYLEQFAALEAEAKAIIARAKALVDAIPKPSKEQDPLGRYEHFTDYTLERAFPNAFGRGGERH